MRLKAFVKLAVLAFATLLAGCGGGGSTDNQPPPPPVTAPVITVQPTAQTVWSPASATFTVQATGSGTLSYQWKKNGVEMPNTNAATFATGPTNVLDHGSIFAVSVSNAAGNVTSASVALTVNELPVVTQQPNDLTVTEGQPASFVTKAQGTPPLTYQWKRNGVAIPGATNATLAIPVAARSDDNALFSAMISNALGTVDTRQATLRVGGASAPPVITQHPQRTTVEVGQTAVLWVTVTGTPPIRYQWRKNGTPITGATGDTLRFNSTQATDAGSYSVVVSNDAGSVTSSAADLIVIVTPLAITTQPMDASAGTGSTATFQVIVVGSPPITYQWLKNGSPVATGGTAAQYTTPPTTLADNGALFAVRITNPAGTVQSANARLQVFPVRTIRGRAGVLSQGPAGETEIPRDLRASKIDAFQPNGTGGYTKTVGVGLSDGTFSIAGVPPGPFLAVLDHADGTPLRALWTTLEDIDFRTFRTGRSDASLSVVGQTFVKVELRTALPAPVSHVELYAPSLTLLKSSTGPVYQWPWLGLPLFDAAKDTVWIAAFQNQSIPAGTLTSIQSAIALPPFNLPDMGETVLAPTMPALAPNQNYTFQAAVPAFGALLPFVNPAAAAAGARGAFNMQLRPQVFGTQIGPIPAWPSVLAFSTAQTTDLDTGVVPHIDPYPAEWARLLTLRQEFAFSLPIPGGGTVAVADAIEETWPLAQLLPASISPSSAPVDQPMVNGVDLFAPPASVGQTPIFTWLPRVGKNPTYYVMTLFEVDAANGKLVARGDYFTEAPNVLLPAGTLKPDTPYVVRIVSVWSRSFDPLNPLKPVWPIATSPVYSAVFKP